MSDDTRNTMRAERRRLAAIMFTDIIGFSRQMGMDEAHTLQLLGIHNRIIRQAVAEHHGVVIKTVGDAFLVDFPSVVHAVQCAQQIQAQLRAHNTDKEKAEQVHVRIGIHLGDIVQQEGDVFGDGVNVASRLQTLAEPDTICISQKVYEEVEKKLPLGTVLSLGRPKLKNIVQRQRVYLLLAELPAGLRHHLQVQRLKLSRRVRPVVFVSVLMLGGLVLFLFPALPTFIIHRSSFITQEAKPPPLPAKPSIVILPFDNMSKDPEQDYFSNGITEVLTSDLSRISNLFVIARNTAFTYKGKAVNVQEIGKELGVRYVLEGSIQKATDQVRIVAQLIDTTTGGHLWSERYDRPLKDIFTLQDEIVQKIVTTLKLQFTLIGQGWIVPKRTDNLEAYDAILRGQEYFWRDTQEAVTVQARQMFEKAVALDPQYAEAYVGLGFTYYREWLFGWNTAPQTLERALALAQQALALDDSLPMAHSLLSSVYVLKQQYDQALAEGKQAIALDPNNADSYMAQAEVLNHARRPEEALRMMEQAMRLNPRYPSLYLMEVGWAYNLIGRYAEAVAVLEEAISRNPNNWGAQLNLTIGYLEQWISQQTSNPQTLEQAAAAAQRVLTLNSASPLGHVILGSVYLWQKQYEQAMAEMERAITLGPNVAGGYAFLAETLSRVGRAEEAGAMVEQALRRKPLLPEGHLGNIGTVYYLTGKSEEAIAPLKQYLTRYPNMPDIHLTLAAVYSELGREVEARAEAAEVLRINPQFLLEVHKQRVPIKDPAMLERQIAALRKAGLK